MIYETTTHHWIDAAPLPEPELAFDATELALLSDLLAMAGVDVPARLLVKWMQPREMILIRLLLEQQKQIQRLRARLNRLPGPQIGYEQPVETGSLLRGVK